MKNNLSSTPYTLHLTRFLFVLGLTLLLLTLHLILYTAVTEAGIFVISGSSRTFRSVDGTSWTEMPSLPAPGAATYQDICRDALGHLYVLRSDGYVYRSVNGGESWTQQSTGPVIATNYDSIIADTGTAGVIYLMCATGEVYRSTDGALTWPKAIATPAIETYVGIAIGKTLASPPRPLFIIDRKGVTYYTNLDLSLAWITPPQSDAGIATDYTDLCADRSAAYGYLYLLDNDGPTSLKNTEGATAAWRALVFSPSLNRDKYVRFEQDLDIFDTYPEHLYTLISNGIVYQSTAAMHTGQTGASPFTQWAPQISITNAASLSSYDSIAPGATSYVTLAVKDSWYRVDPGAIYDVDFQDTNFGTVFSASYTICSLPGQGGTRYKGWTTIADNINVSLSTANWGIDFSACQEATTNFVSVRVLDNGGNETVVNDVFYVLKDTTSPLAVNLNIPLPGTTITYQNVFFDWYDSTDTRSGIENYLLQISTASNFSIINYSSSPVISQVTITITVDNLYYWRVRAKDKAGNYSVTWDTRSFTVNATSPSVPSNFQAIAGGELVNLSWSSNTETDMWRYEIQRSSFSPSVGFSSITYILHPGTTHQDTGLVSDNTYYYKIQAIDTADNPSGFTSTVSAIPYDTIPPAKVFDLTASTGTNEGETKLTWPAPGDDGMYGTLKGEYRIQYSTWTDIFWSTGSTQGTVITISTSGVTPGTTVSTEISNLYPSNTYYFHLWSADEKYNWSTLSNRATSWAQDLVPSTPTWITAVSSDTIIALSWNANPEVDMSSYVIKCSSYSSIPEVYTSITITLSHPTTSYQHSGLENSVTYYYKIKAVDRSGKESGYSTVVSTYPWDRILPGNVTLFISSAQAQGNTIHLSWSTATITATDFQGVRICSNTAGIPTDYNIGIVTDVPKGTTYYLHTGLIDNVTYYYRAWAYDEVPNYAIEVATTSTYPRDTLPPENVTLFTSSAQLQGNAILLTWSTATINAVDFQGVRICSSTVDYPTNYNVGIVTDVPKGTTFYLDTGLIDNVTYYYRAWSYDEVRNYAVEIATTSTYPRDTVTPAPVSNFIVNDPGLGIKLELSWTNPPDIDFEATVIRCRTDGIYPTTPYDGVFVSTVTKPGNSYIHTGLTTGTTYYYSVFTRDEVSNYSGPVTSSGYPTLVITPPTISSITPSIGEQGTIVTIDTITGTNFQSGATVVLKKIGYVNISTYTPFTVSYSTTLTSGQFDLTVTTNAVIGFWTVRVTNPDGGYGELVNGFQIVDTSAPAAVNNLTASPGSAEKTITLTWNYTGDRGNTGPLTDGSYAIKWASYTVTWSTTSANVIASTSVAQGAGASYTISNLIEGATYYIRLWLADEIPNWSEISNGATTWSQRQPPGDVSSFIALPVGKGEKINLSWVNPGEGDFAGTRIRYRTDGFFPTGPSDGFGVDEVNGDISAPTTYYLDIGLTDGVTYYYKAFAYDNAVTPNYAGGVSTSTYPRDALPPTNVTLFISTAQPQGNTILLTWSTAAITATDFQGVRICSSPVSYPTNYNIGIVTDVAKTTTYYLDIGLVDNLTYYYRAWAYDEVRNYAIEVATTSTYPRDILPPTNVTLFTSSAQPQGNTIHLSWSTATIIASDFQGVRICSSTVGYPGPTGYNVGIVTDVAKTTTYYLDIGLVDNLTYYYRAWAYDEVRNYAIEVATTSTYPRDTIPPAKVTTLSTGTVTGNSIELRWTAPGDNNVTGDIVNGSYWIKYSSSVLPIDETNWNSVSTEIVWSTNTSPGNIESRIVSGLQTDTTYYFALRTRDEMPNQWSYVSNCATGTTRDVTPPAKVTNLSAESGVSAGSVRLTWTAPGDDLAIGTATIYAIKYSPTLPFDWNTAFTWRADRPVGGGAGYPEEEIVTGLTPGTSYYFYLKTADEVPNWSDLSNGATGYATAVVAALTLYKTTTYTDTPFTADSSCKLSTTPMTISNLATFANTGKSVGYMQFCPLVTNNVYESLPTGITQYGWLYQIDQEFKTLFSGKWSMKIGWQSTSADGRGYLWYRICKVTATASGLVERRETLLSWTYSPSILGGNTALNHSAIDTPTVSSTTFAKGEFLFIEFFIQQSVAQRTPGDGWSFQVNTTSNYVVTPDIRDITLPAAVTDFYAVTSSTKGMVDLSWTAVGNNDLLGQATYYDIRWVTDPAFDWVANWSLATIWKDKRPTGGPAGTSETETVTGLTPGTTYYFRLRTYDDAIPVANWRLSNQAIAWVYVATHTVNVYNTAPIHKRMNNGKKDDLLRISISNARGAGYGAIYLSTVTVRFTVDGLNALTTAQAKNLFQNIYLYADDQQDGFYHYSQDITTVARVTNANISLTDGNQEITTLTVGARRLNPQEIKNYFLVVELQPSASSQTISTFTVTISELANIKIIDEITQSTDTLGTSTNFPLVSYSVSAIEPATKRPGTNWPFNIGAKVQSIPLVYWDRVYIGADNGNFYCLDSSGTTQLWLTPFSTDGNSAVCTAPFPDWKFYDPDTGGGSHYIYFTDVAGNVYKIEDQGNNWAYGIYGWKRTDVNVSTSSWLGNDRYLDNLYVGSTDSKVYKIDYSTGGNALYFPVFISGAGALTSTPAVDTYTELAYGLWIGGSGGIIYRLNTETGDITMSFNTGGAINASPNLVAGYSVDVGGTTNNLYFASTNGKLYCRTASNLTSTPSGWSDFNASSPIYSNPYFTPYEGGQYVYFGADNGKLYKVNASNGGLVWSYQTDGKIRSTPMSDGTYVYFTSDDGYIYCLTTGGSLRDKWPVHTGAPVRSSPSIDIDNKTLTIGSDDKNVYQFYIGD